MNKYIQYIPVTLAVLGSIIALTDLYIWIISGYNLFPPERIFALAFLSVFMGFIAVIIFAIED